MAYGIPSGFPRLFGGPFEYPGTDFYSSDLSEMLAYYKHLVEVYEEILEKLRQAQKDWQDSRDYVEKWNQKWSKDMVDLRRTFTETTQQISKVQEELLKRFETERASMAHYMDDVLWQIKEDNRKKVEEIKDSNQNQLAEFEQIQTNYRNAMKEMLDIFSAEFEASLNLLNLNLKGSNNVLMKFIGDEISTLIGMIKALENSNDSYYNNMLEKYEDLLSALDDKLHTAIGELRLEFKNAAKDYTTEVEFKSALNALTGQINALSLRIEEVNNARVDIQAKKVLIMSPVTHNVKRIQWVLDEMWFFFSAWAISAEELSDLGITAEALTNWVCDKGLLPEHVGITALEIATMSKWILLEKPDILAQLQGQIGDITYDALSENKDKITAEITNDAIVNTASHFAGIISTVTMIAGRLEPIETAIDNLDGTVQVLDGRTNDLIDSVLDINSTLFNAELNIKENGNFEIKKGVDENAQNSTDGSDTV